jgi:arsenate reductase
MAVKKVLFLCIGNSVRSQMAEGFARKYGSDVMEVASAGFSPASIVQPSTKKVMEAKNISLENHFPKDLEHVPLSGFDLIVNISGKKLPTKLNIEVLEWAIDDPMGKSEQEYVIARDKIEHLVMRLILELRKNAKAASARAPAPRPNPARPVRPQKVR